MVLLAPPITIVWKAASVPIWSADVPPSNGPGWSVASPMLASLEFASTWLLLRM